MGQGMGQAVWPMPWAVFFAPKRKKIPKTKGFRNFGGKSTAHGYNAPCFDDMVHCLVGSGLIRRDNEDGKDNIKSAYRTV